jgi:membrane associated rhomboid family serine protease
VIANLARCLVPLQFASLGASGMVMGALGLITVHSMLHQEPAPTRGRRSIRGFCAGVLLLVLLGFNPHPQTDVLAHVVGFLAGLLLGSVSLVASRLQPQRS